MGYLLWLVVALWTAYAIYIVKFMREVFHKKILYLRKPNLENNIKYQCAARPDIVNLSELKTYLALVFIVPIRLILTIPFFMLGIFVFNLLSFIFRSRLG